MAETLVSLARDHLLPYLMEIANMVRGVPQDVEDMKKELEKIQTIIYNSEKVTAAGDGITTREEMKAKVKLLIEAAFRMEDVIDEYLISEEQQPRDPGCVALPCEPANFMKTMIFRLQIAYQIQEIKSRVRAINESGKRESVFHIQSFLEQGPSSSRGNQNATLEWIREAPLYIREDQIVGFEAPMDELVGWLVKGRADRTVISVVGMGGQGKTTLAKKVFDNKEVRGYFNCHAWITVSQTYTVEGLLEDMLQKFCTKNNARTQKNSTKDRRSLIDEVRSYLQQKRYVVVFDDVWDEKFWDQIDFAVNDNNNGSRILITTRSMNVAVSCQKSSFVKIHELKPLTKEKSWELFCKKAFRCEPDGCCPKHLEHVSSEIVEKCNSLPLALVAIGGLLSLKDKSRVDEWRQFSRNLSLELHNQHLDSITKILGFSYNDLPFHLKSCFLYFGIYPEDEEIESKRMIRQWIAEGFVKYEEGKTLEEVAEGYLKELVHRSLVQVSSFTIDGKAKRCRVHDLIREMILKKNEDLRFCHNVHDKTVLLSGLTRRLSITISSNDLLSRSESSPIRSLFVFTYEELPEHFVSRIPTKYMLLNVLDFEDAVLEYVPENLGNLIHLKYLSFRNTLLRSLPNSIAKLQNLETLDLRGALVTEMPVEISKLRKLRHLLCHHMSLIELKDGIGGMTSLQTLSKVIIDEDGVELIRELGRLTQLRMFGVREEHGSALYSSINKMQWLESLRIKVDLGHDVFGSQFDSCPPMLRKLTLSSNFEKLPEWIPKLQNLVELSLLKFELTDDPMKSLKDLPNLLYLDVSSYEGVSFHFQVGGFKNLKKLILAHQKHLNSIFIDEGALCSLKYLMLYSMPGLKAVPFGFQHLKKLEVLIVYHTSIEFEQNIAPIGGPQHMAIQHVPLVEITCLDERTRTIHH